MRPSRLLSSARLSLPAGLVLAAVLALAVWAQGMTFPDLTGRIVDQAGIITGPARGKIEQKLAEHDAKTSDQVVVATVTSLQGTSVEDYANRLFRHWKLGQAKTNNGVLLLVAPNEKKVRIEVGYGLEGQLTDAVSSMIIQAALVPKFRAGDFAGGIEAAVEAIVSTLQGGTEWQERVKLRASPQDDSYDPVLFILFVFIIIVVFIMLSNANRPRGPGGGMHRKRGGDWIVIGPSSGGWSGGSSWGGGDSGGGFSGGGGDSGGGGASGSW